jgi:GNAT superfamily N-acetyltransferase
MSDIEVEEIPLPGNLIDDPAAPDFLATVEIRNLIEELGYGTPDVRVTPEKLLAYWSDPYSPHRLFVVRADGRVVGRGMYETQLDDGSTAAWVDVRVHPDYRGRGIGTALAERVEQLGRAENRTHVIVYIVSADGPGDRIEPPTGSGSLPAGNPEVRFLLGRGYRLEQVVRASRLPLPIDAGELSARLVRATDRAGEAYVVHRWAGPTPVEFRDDIALLNTRMSTDAPQSGLDEPEDVWTAQRLAEHEEHTTADGTVLLTSAVLHVDEGRLVGFTQFALPTEPGRPVDQYDTLVLKEHRGHGLGMVLKLANLEFLQQEHSGPPSVITWNADENRHMLAVNEELGFEPIGYDGAWRLDLT